MNIAHHFGAALQAQLHLVGGHCGPVMEVAGRPTHFHVDDAVSGRYVVVNACVYKNELESMLIAQEVYARAPFGKVSELLPCHLLGRHAHAVGYDSMVGCKQDVVGIAQFR